MKDYFGRGNWEYRIKLFFIKKNKKKFLRKDTTHCLHLTVIFKGICQIGRHTFLTHLFFFFTFTIHMSRSECKHTHFFFFCQNTILGDYFVAKNFVVGLFTWCMNCMTLPSWSVPLTPWMSPVFSLCHSTSCWKDQGCPLNPRKLPLASSMHPGNVGKKNAMKLKNCGVFMVNNIHVINI